MEVVVSLVGTAVFKTVEPYGKHAVGGFDSHALPPFFVVPTVTGSCNGRGHAQNAIDGYGFSRIPFLSKRYVAILVDWRFVHHRGSAVARIGRLERFETDRFGTEEILDFAIGIPLPLTAT